MVRTKVDAGTWRSSRCVVLLATSFGATFRVGEQACLEARVAQLQSEHAA